jgi:uncharacterized protein YaaR (DUF327 family)
MKLDQFSRILNERRSSMSSVRAASLKREIRGMIKTLLQTEVYKDLPNYKLLDVFMEKFRYRMRTRNLKPNELKAIAKGELQSLRSSYGEVSY